MPGLEFERITQMTRCRLHARYGSANIRTWIGFKQFMGLAEEAVLTWFRERGHGPQQLYHSYGVGLSIVDSSVMLPAVLEIDDEVEAAVEWTRPGRFGVRLTVDREGQAVTVMRGKLSVALVAERIQPPGAAPANLPEYLSPLAVPSVKGEAEPPVAGKPFHFPWRARYFHCHFSDRVQHGTYVAALEEVVDRFLEHRGISVPRLLTERGWIPVVSRARVRLLADAHMDEDIQTSFSVSDIVKDRGYDGRMDSHVTVDGQPTRHVATAQILHGYAVSQGELAGTLAELDAQTIQALTAETS